MQQTVLSLMVGVELHALAATRASGIKERVSFASLCRQRKALIDRVFPHFEPNPSAHPFFGHYWQSMQFCCTERRSSGERLASASRRIWRRVELLPSGPRHRTPSRVANVVD